MITENEVLRIKELRDNKLSGNKIILELNLRRTDVFRIIRQLEGKKEPSKKQKIIFTREKYLTPKQIIIKEKVIEKRYTKRIEKQPLINKEKKFIKEQVNKREPDYKIVKEFNINRRKKVYKEIKKFKNIEKKKKLKEINKKFENKCKFNYITQHHIGYKFNKSVSYQIFVGITDAEITDINNDISSKLKLMNSKINCYQRISYSSLEYVIKLQDNSKEYSKISTNMNTALGLSDFNNMLSQIPDLIIYLVNLVHQSQSSKHIEIYNIVYVNYDIKNNVV